MNSSKIYSLIFLVISFLLSLVSLGYWYLTNQEVNAKAEELKSISTYSFDQLSANESLKNEYPLWSKLSDIPDFLDSTKSQIKATNDQRIRFSLPYENFLHFFYVPSLNIWKDPFTGSIDTTLVWVRYLENNPYSDIQLIQDWTNFFKDMWSIEQYNTITDISIGTMQSVDGGFFSLPITVQFETPDRRSFLLLVNKLSMTSYADNISLINEFTLNLREQIKKDKKEQIWQLLSWGSLPPAVTNEDQAIGYLLYQRVKSDSDTISILDTDIINKTITKVSWCVDESSEECLYLFREKFRAVPYLSYTVGKNNTDHILWFKQFLRQLPPIININSFSFDQNSKVGRKSRDDGYKWSISISVYGKDLKDIEVDEIAKKLGWSCFKDSVVISPAQAVVAISKQINQLWQQDSINAKRWKELKDIDEYITKISLTYNALTNQKKVIKLFEIYRTLHEWSICDFVATNKQKKPTPPISQSQASADPLLIEVKGATAEPLVTKILSAEPIPLLLKSDSIAATWSLLTWSLATGNISTGNNTKSEEIKPKS